MYPVKNSCKLYSMKKPANPKFDSQNQPWPRRSFKLWWLYLKRKKTEQKIAV